MPGLALPCQLSLSLPGRAWLMHQAYFDGLGQVGQDENLGFPACASLSHLSLGPWRVQEGMRAFWGSCLGSLNSGLIGLSTQQGPLDADS